MPSSRGGDEFHMQMVSAIERERAPGPSISGNKVISLPARETNKQQTENIEKRLPLACVADPDPHQIER